MQDIIISTNAWLYNYVKAWRVGNAKIVNTFEFNRPKLPITIIKILFATEHMFFDWQLIVKTLHDLNVWEIKSPADTKYHLTTRSYLCHHLSYV